MSGVEGSRGGGVEADGPPVDDRERVIGRRVIRRQSVSSTMDEIAALAARGEPEGTVVVAETQTEGRGRAGRAWAAPPGTAILCSVLLRPAVPAARLGSLGLVAGVAVAETVERATGLECRLKWPNDVWLDERKVAGILLSTRYAIDQCPRVVLGIGLNVNLPASSLPEGATSLLVATGKTYDRSALLDLLLARLDAGYRAYLGAGGAPDLSGWRRRAALVGEPVAVVVEGAARTGVLRGAADDGALLLELPDGRLERVVSGDLVRGPVRVTTGDATDAPAAQ